ncbi:MAG: M67 family metallopeptidase [Sulfolobales archaeon]
MIKESILNAIISNTVSMEIESCGLLIGVFRDTYAEVLDHRVATNILRSRYEFEIDPRELIETYTEAKEKGMEIVGIYHTHISYPPTPSKKDVEGMKLWPIPWLIISIPSREYAAWMLCEERIVRLRIALS